MAKATCGTCGNAFGEVSTTHVFATEWSFDETANAHYYACTVTGCMERNGQETCSVGEHGTEATCMAKATCGTCGNAFGEISTTHAFAVVWSVDAEAGTHYYACTVAGCTERDSETAHVFDTAEKDDTHHWNKCVCGATDTKVEHDFADYGHNESGHWFVCDCGKIQTDSDAAHSFTIANQDETGHWMECVCGAVDETTRGAHTYVVPDHDDVEHWTECACGWKDAATITPHSYDYVSDDAAHWRVCSCSYQEPESRQGHTWNTGACEICLRACDHDTDKGFTYETCTDDATKHDRFCAECETLLGAAEDHFYDTGYYVSDVDYHWVACPCGVKQDVNAPVAHTTTSPATCNKKAECEVCGEYGEFNPDVHGSTEYTYAPIPGDIRQHNKLHACCEVLVAAEDHTYTDGVCTACNYECTHVGGTATCKDKAVCAVCGQSYGELSTDHKYTNACDGECDLCGATRAPAAHKYGDWKVTKEATATEKGSKERTCSVCGAKETQEIDVLSGDDANNANDGKDGNTKNMDTTTVIIIVVAAVAGVGLIVAIIAVIAKKKAAAAAVAAPAWRTKKTKKKKWKKRK